MSKIAAPAEVGGFFRGKAFGGVAQMLLANNMNINSLRTLDTLRHEEWIEIDKAVLKSYQENLIAVADLNRLGLTYNLKNGMGKTVLAYEDMSDTEAADVSMDGITRGRNDRPEFDMNYLPLPLIHKDFWFSARALAASRNDGSPLDTTMAELAARKVAEKVEEILLVGASTYTFGGGTIYGYADFTHANTGNLTAAWTASAATGETILADILAMKQALIDDRCSGPYMVYISTSFSTAIDEDFKSDSDKTIRNRLKEVAGILDIRVADKLTAGTVLMVQMTSDVVRIVNGLPITNVQWDMEGGLATHFKVMTIQVPQLRADQSDRAGVAVWT